MCEVFFMSSADFPKIPRKLLDILNEYVASSTTWRLGCHQRSTEFRKHGHGVPESKLPEDDIDKSQWASSNTDDNELVEDFREVRKNHFEDFQKERTFALLDMMSKFIPVSKCRFRFSCSLSRPRSLELDGFPCFCSQYPCATAQDSSEHRLMYFRSPHVSLLSLVESKQHSRFTAKYPGFEAASQKRGGSARSVALLSPNARVFKRHAVWFHPAV
ncbi:unnamed protein product [Symbiodinium sp. CCMP2592]|nr:unnamed protein product [Symbiodinium sp. CCMP2592]